MAYPDVMPVTPGEFSSMWEVISRLRKANGDLAGSQRAKQAAYAIRLGRAVITKDRAARVAAITRLRDPMKGSPSREVRAMAKATTAGKGLTVEFKFERDTKNFRRYQEVENGHDQMIGTLYLNKSASLILGNLPESITVTITPGA